MCEFLFSDDRTILVNIINLLCKMGLFLIILLLMFQIEHLMILGLWLSLLMTSPYQKLILNYLKPFLEFVVGEYSRIVGKIS